MGITADIQARLVAIERTMLYGGVAVNATDYTSEAIADFQLPLFINRPTNARRVQFSDTGFSITRLWVIQLWGRKDGLGGRAENELLMQELTDLVYILFLSRQRLELNGVGLAHLNSAVLSGNSEVELRPYPDGADSSALHYMVEFQMEIEYESSCYV